MMAVIFQLGVGMAPHMAYQGRRNYLVSEETLDLGTLTILCCTTMVAVQPWIRRRRESTEYHRDVGSADSMEEQVGGLREGGVLREGVEVSGLLFLVDCRDRGREGGRGFDIDGLGWYCGI